MSFERLFRNDLLVKDFNKQRYVRGFKGRANISKAKLDTYSNVRYLKVKETHITRYDSELAPRYAAALDTSYDMLLSIFDVNARNTIIFRTFGPDQTLRGSIDKYLLPLRRGGPNVEVRIIGMQNGEEYSHLYEIAELLNSKGLPLLEVDLFGTETRHIAFDTKLGMSFNVLVNDRLYRPGELANNLTLEQFEKSISPAP